MRPLSRGVTNGALPLFAAKGQDAVGALEAVIPADRPRLDIGAIRFSLRSLIAETAPVSKEVVERAYAVRSGTNRQPTRYHPLTVGTYDLATIQAPEL